MRPDNNFCLFLFCQLDFQDNCEDSPCGEGSRCLDSYFVYYCDCKQGYAGDQCQIGRYIIYHVILIYLFRRKCLIILWLVTSCTSFLNENRDRNLWCIQTICWWWFRIYNAWLRHRYEALQIITVRNLFAHDNGYISSKGFVNTGQMFKIWARIIWKHCYRQPVSK